MILYNVYRFTINQYLAEAYSMLGQYHQALDCLKSELDPELKCFIDNVATGLREADRLTQKSVTSLNTAAIYLCSG